MAITDTKRGYALIIAIIVMSVMLSFGLSLGSLAYKQSVLASGARESVYAFYAADAALECMLYADQQLNAFSYADHYDNPGSPPPSSPGNITCNGTSVPYSSYTPDPGQTNRVYSVMYRVPVSASQCAEVYVYKKRSDQSAPNTTIYSQGYDVSCATVASPGGARIISRGMYLTN